MKKTHFTRLWQQYEPLIKAIIELFHPFVEVAVHDVKKGQVVAIYNNISRREIGEASPLQELGVSIHQFPEYFHPYYKKNWDGRSLKCTSITLRDDEGKPVGLICINVDVSSFKEGYQLIERFLKIEKGAENPIEIFGGQLESQADFLIRSYLEEHHLQLQRLKPTQKKELVQHLFRKGLFNFKNAAPLVAGYLSISRASIYNYINQLGGKNHD